MIYHYNPIHFSLKELEETTVGREELLNLLFNSIKEQAEKKTHQHWLLVGPRGIGKSHLISFIYHRIKEEEGFRKKWLPILFPEQGYGIISLLDFMVKIIKLAQGEEEGWDKILEDIRGEKETDAVEKIRAFLIGQAIKRKRKLLLLVENLDRVFGKRVIKIKDPYKERWLRSLLMNDNVLLLIGTSTSVFKQLIDHKHALYNFFRIEELEDFSDNDCQGLWLKRAELEGRQDFLETIKRNRALLMVLSTLTGGNPRLILMLYEIALEYERLEEIERLFYHLLEELTPYFQSRTENLSPQQEKILIAFAESPFLLTPGQISKKLHIPTNTVTAQLNELEKNGFVRFVRKEKGIGALYDLEEHLYRYWHLSTTDRGLVEMFIRFISLWYSEAQLREYRKMLIHTADTRPQYARLLEYTEAALKLKKRIRIIKAEREIQEVYEKREFRRVIELSKRYLRKKPDSLYILNLYGIALAEEGAFADSVIQFSRITEIEPKDYGAFYNWGLALSDLARLKQDEGLFQEAFEKYKRAVELKPDFPEAFHNWGNALLRLAELKQDERLFQEAFEKYKRAVELKPDYFRAFNNWGIALSDLAKLKRDEGLFREAFEKYEKVVELEPDDPEGFYSWGIALSELAELKQDEGLFQESFEKFKMAVELKPDFYEAFCKWGDSLLEFATLKRDEKLFREVIEKCKKVLELDPDHFSAFSKWGVALLELAELKHNENYLKEALQQFIASWEIIKKKAILDYPSMIDTLLTAAWLSLRVDRETTYKRLVYELLEALPRVKILKQIHSIFYTFLINILKLRRFKEAEEFINELSRTPYKEEFDFLEPFKYIIQYYTQDKRVIGRISRELQKVCKEIIAAVEEAGVKHGR
ncbi:MAG: hypothetical protein A3G93_06195 [Nitrospinae bacterium RIFCSPLOWO2_12_FULL_45_22]|nr:MAG: hypothetical protein A3G93_06195 [Nitrospinae bacterium RIFCSPLOWO2_12_FULL_45_22]